jgi:hypothetical protein
MPAAQDNFLMQLSDDARRRKLADEMTHSLPNQGNALEDALYEHFATMPEYVRGGLNAFAMNAHNAVSGNQEAARSVFESLPFTAAGITKKEAYSLANLLSDKIREKGGQARLTHWPTGSSYIDASYGKKYLRSPIRISDHPPSPRAVDLREYTQGPERIDQIDDFVYRLMKSLE